MNTYSQLFKEREQMWFEKIKPFLPTLPSKILKIGNGFGHLSEMVRAINSDTTILEIALHTDTVNAEYVQIYDGNTIPANNKSFDTTILNLTLHHVKNSKTYFVNEILRVTKQRVILVEETYDNLFQKMHLVFRDWWFNLKANQPCPIHWNSYFSRNEIDLIAKNNHLKSGKRITTKHHSYFKELIVIDL